MNLKMIIFHALSIKNLKKRCKQYNKTIVSVKINPDNNSDGYGGIDTDFFEDWFRKICMLIGIIVLLVILNFYAPIITTILSMLFKGAWIIISLPFKILSKIFNAKKEKPQQALKGYTL